jgi:hypothetical protein
MIFSTQKIKEKKVLNQKNLQDGHPPFRGTEWISSGSQ